MTPEEHKQRHKELHRAVDELFADYIEHHPNQIGFINMPLQQLLEWSFEQTQNPTEKPTCQSA